MTCSDFHFERTQTVICIIYTEIYNAIYTYYTLYITLYVHLCVCAYIVKIIKIYVGMQEDVVSVQEKWYGS